MSNMLVQAIEELDNSEEGYAILIDFHNCIFFVDGVEISWNTDNNLKDLTNGDGNTCGGELMEGSIETENFFIANVDTQQGTWVTKVFLKSNRVHVHI